MHVTHFAATFVLMFALFSLFAGALQAGDVGRAKRDLMMAKDNADSGRWDDLDSNMKKAATDMDGLSDAEKAPLLATIADIKSTVTKNIEAEVTKRLDKAAAADAGGGKFDIDRAAARLNSDEAKAYADPAVIEKLKARIASMSGTPTTPPATTTTPKTTTTPPKTSTPTETTTTPPPKATTTPPPTGKMSDELAAAAAKARSARNIFAQGTGIQDYNMADSFMRDANKQLAALSDPGKAPIVEDMAALGKEIDEAEYKWQRKEEFNRVDGQVSRYVSDAQNGIQAGVVGFPDRINKAEQLLASEDVKMYMDAEHIKEYQSKIDAIRVEFKAHNKEVSLQRAEPIIKELEAEVAADPFKGIPDGSAYTVFSKLNTLSDRARAEFRLVPKDDPQIKAALDRVTVANAKMEASAGKYAVQKMEEQFAASWKFNSQNFAGWEAETLSPTSIAQRRVEGLGKTAQAVSGTVYWLNAADTKTTIEKYKTDAVVMATAGSAQKTLDEASAKLNDAFNAVLASAEKEPMPARESDRASIGYLALDAGHWFAGTKYKDANVARASALDAKWKADVARMEKEMEETLKKLSAQADAAWSAIEASSGAEKGFSPTDVSTWKGKTVLIKGYWNRTGWDFDAAWDFAVDIKGVPVAGKFEPNVMAAFKEGSSHTKFGINDHMNWDLIAVVQGKGEIKRRTNTEWKDKDTHEVILKTETYVPEPCVVLKIIGLHAGPVAVGPK